jgi:polyhydroxyalkanoate synthase
MTTPVPDPAQWLGSLFHSDALLAPPWQALSSPFAVLQREYFKQIGALWQAAAQLPQDKRFAGEAWRTDPRFEMATRSYQAYSSVLNDAIASSPLDEKTKGQWGFVARQLVDALSPSNFLATNPEAMQLVAESGGRSLIDGMGLLVQDLLKGRITMTDENAFELGRNIATTEGAVIFENELMQLIRYAPLKPRVHQRPLLMVPPCINKFYIRDLQRDNSLVRYALEQGHQVFLVSWRSATPQMGHLTWDDYLASGVTQAIDVVLDASGADTLNALGFCLGGTLLACATAVERSRGQQRVASLTLLTTMLDFVDTGELGLLVTEASVAAREQAIGRRGLMHGAELALTFSSLRANDLIWPYVVNSYLKGKAPPAFDLLYWNSDATNLPGPMYCWYLRNAYLENKLAQPGGTLQCGVPVDLRSLDMPAYLYASREDHIVPWRTAYASHRVLSGDTTFVLGASGHIAGVINPAAKNKRNHWVGPRPTDDADAWQAGATDVPGSWWPNWSAWLARHAGPQVAAPKPSARGRYRAIEAAPGRYVKEKAQ